MKKYHLRRKEKLMTDNNEIIEVIENEKFMTLAMCSQNEPYLVTLNYGFDKNNNCFYFHCALEGKKIDFLNTNPIVWGQIIQDNGYIHGKCDHDYKCIHFRGEVEFIKTIEQKKRALFLMIDQLEKDPDPLKQRLQDRSFDEVGIGKVQVLDMIGKKYVEQTE